MNQLLTLRMSMVEYILARRSVHCASASGVASIGVQPCSRGRNGAVRVERDALHAEAVELQGRRVAVNGTGTTEILSALSKSVGIALRRPPA